MKTVRSDLALLGLAVVAVLAELACVLTGHTPPGLFEQVTLVGVAGAAGVSLPTRSTPTPTDSAPAAAQAYATYQAAQTAPTMPAAAGFDPHTYSGPEGL